MVCGWNRPGSCGQGHPQVARRDHALRRWAHLVGNHYAGRPRCRHALPGTGRSHPDRGGRLYPSGRAGTVFSIGDTTTGGGFSGRASIASGVIALSGEFAFYLQDEFIDPLDIGVEGIDLGETVYENLLRPLDDLGREQLGLPPTGPQRFGVHTGEPYAITAQWSGRFEGQIDADIQRSIYR